MRLINRSRCCVYRSLVSSLSLSLPLFLSFTHTHIHILSIILAISFIIITLLFLAFIYLNLRFSFLLVCEELFWSSVLLLVDDHGASVARALASPSLFLSKLFVPRVSIISNTLRVIITIIVIMINNNNNSNKQKAIEFCWGTKGRKFRIFLSRKTEAIFFTHHREQKGRLIAKRKKEIQMESDASWRASVTKWKRRAAHPRLARFFLYLSNSSVYLP